MDSPASAMQALTFWAEQPIVAPLTPGGFSSLCVVHARQNWRKQVKETAMVFRSMQTATMALLGIVAFTALPTVAQQPATGTKVVQFMGLEGVKAKSNGRLTLEGGNLQFTGSNAKATVPLHSIEDVVTGNDSQRVFRGTIGTLTMFAPYGGGRFLSLFRSKVDTLTIQYRDAEGGLHGAIFTMATGKADGLKKEMIAQGARTSIPIQEDAGSSETKPAAAKEKKP